jgi:hypothetical protein
MRHILNVTLIICLSFILAIAQFFVTGIYGRIMFIPILVTGLTYYLIGYTLNPTKVLKK